MSRMQARRVWAMCNTCSYMIHSGRISEHYAEAVTRQLFMTIAHESDGFRARRQYGFSPDTTTGAFGFAQNERASIEQGFYRMWRGDAVGKACRDYLDLWGSKKPVNPHECRMFVQEPLGDPLSVLLCRLHYLRVPAPIPLDLEQMSRYAKQHYNTHLGKATPEDYLRAFHRHWPGDLP
jgi:hypothetical protein